MFLQIQTELNLPNRLAEEQEQQLVAWKRKVEVLERQKADEVKALKSEIESYKRMVERQKKDFEKGCHIFCNQLFLTLST